MIRKENAIAPDAVDIRRIAHHAVCIRAEIPHPDVIAKDDEYVGFCRAGIFRHESLLVI
jgi:hypothetical protein